MAERLGNVLYWIGCICAVAIAGIGVILYLGEPGHAAPAILLAFLVFALIALGIGRAIRYVLAGT
jgi:hypothetical protein